MQYVVVVEIDETLLDGDESIENLVRLLNLLAAPLRDRMTIRPLSEIIAC